MEQSRRSALTIAGFIFLLRWTATGGISSSIKCNVHLFQTLQLASLVCQYNTSLRNRNENYWIEFCEQNSECSDAISCNWDEAGQELHCVPGPTFRGMSCAVTDFLRGDLICLLPNVHSRHSGSYTCHLVPPDGRVQQSCAVVVPWGKKKDEEKSKDEGKSHSVHEWLQTTILIVLLAVVIVIIVFLIREKLKKRKRRESPENERGPHNQGPSQNSTSRPTPAVGTEASPRQETQQQAGQFGNQEERPADTTQQTQSPGNRDRTENPVSSPNLPSTSAGTVAGNTERVPQAQSGQDVADHDETNDENMAEASKPLLSGLPLDSTETTNKPPKVDNPSIVYNYSTNTCAINVLVADRKDERKLQSPQDPGISKHIDSSITGLEMEANSSLTDPVKKETPTKKMRSISVA